MGGVWYICLHGRISNLTIYYLIGSQSDSHVPRELQTFELNGSAPGHLKQTHSAINTATVARLNSDHPT